VTEINAGRKTAGVDGRVVLEAWEKAELATWLQHGAPGWRPQPVKRVFIPKANGKQRGLGIPVIADRALQALTVGALEPEPVACRLLTCSMSTPQSWRHATPHACRGLLNT
jgi:RNA-directed DNA polymerase